MNQSKKSLLLSGAMLALSLIAVTPTFAQTPNGGQQANNPNQGQHRGGFLGIFGGKDGNKGKGMENARRGVMGTVTAISGNTITVSSQMRQPKDSTAAPATTVYTVDATNAKIEKNGTASTIASIVIGDKIMAQGTLSGTTLTATMINDGMPERKGVFGSVTAVSGNTITVSEKDKDNTATLYTIDATNAKIMKAGAQVAVGSIAVGDTVMVQGTITGTSVAATMINDGEMKMGEMKGPGDRQNISFGTVATLSGASFTLTSKDKSGTATTVTVNTTGTTTFKKDGAAATLADLAVGENIVVNGAKDASNVIAAPVNVDIVTKLPPARGDDQNGKNHPVMNFFKGIGAGIMHIFGK